MRDRGTLGRGGEWRADPGKTGGGLWRRGRQSRSWSGEVDDALRLGGSQTSGCPVDLRKLDFILWGVGISKDFCAE